MVASLPLQFIKQLAYWPIWWYGPGLVLVGRGILRMFRRGSERLAIGIWMRNLTVPMYGQYDWEGRLISFAIRVIQIIVRSLLLLVWLAVAIALLAFWIGYLPLVWYQVTRYFPQ